MVSTAEIWDELASVGDRVEHRDGWHSRRVYKDADCGIFVALRYPGAVPALLIEVDAVSVQVTEEYPAARGFEFYPETITPGPRGRTRLCLVLADARYRDVLEVLVNDVSEKVANSPGQEEGVKTLIARLHIWQNFMRKHGVQGLRKEEQIGLFGELSFLVDHLINWRWRSAHESVNAWKGPIEGNQDFDFGGCCVEVKSTTVVPPVSVKIANLTQLDETLMDLLLLCHTSLILDRREGQSLPELVDRLRTVLQGQDVSALDAFNAKLIEAGYLDLHREVYADTRYKHRETTFYRIGEDFPRITVNDIPVGIFECSYSVLLAACAPYKVEITDVFTERFNERKTDSGA